MGACTQPPPPASRDGYVLEVRGGTTNLDSSYFNPSFSSAGGDKVSMQQKAQALRRFGVAIDPQATQAVGVNLFVSVLKDGAAPAQKTTLTVGGLEGSAEFEAGQVWDVLFPLPPHQNGNSYTVTAETGGVRLQQSVGVNAGQEASGLLPIPQNLRVSSTQNLVVASWDRVPGAGSYIALLYDNQQRKVLWAEGLTGNRAAVSGLSLEGFSSLRYDLTVFALSWNLAAPQNEPYPQPVPSSFNASAAARYVTISAASIESVKPASIMMSTAPGAKVSGSAVIKTYEGGPLSYELSLPAGSPVSLLAPASATGFVMPGQQLEVRVEGTCPPTETDLSVNLGLRTNSQNEPNRTIPITLECSRSLQASLAVSKPGQIGSYDVTWSPDGSKVAVLSAGKLILWDAASTEAVRVISPGLTQVGFNSQDALAWSPNSSRIAVGAGEQIRVFDASTGAEVVAVSGRRPLWSPNGAYIAAAGYQRLALFNATTGAQLWSMAPGIYDSTKVRWSPNSETLYAVVSDWDSANNRSINRLQTFRASDGAVAATPVTLDSNIFDITPGGTQAIGVAGGALTVWNLSDGSVARTLRAISGSPSDLAVSPTGTQVAVLLGYSTTTAPLMVVSMTTGDTLFSRTYNTPAANSGNMAQVAWNPAGTEIAFSDTTGLTPIVDATSGNTLRQLGFFTGQVSSLAFSPDTPTLLAGSAGGLYSSGPVSGVRSLDVSSRAVKVIDPNALATSLQWIKGTDRIAGITGQACCFLVTWDAQTATQLSSRSVSSSSGVAWSRDGARLAYRGSNQFTVLRLDTGSTVNTPTINNPYGQAQWSPDDQQFAVSDGNSILIFDGVTAQRLRSVTLSQGIWMQYGFAWARGGKLVVPGGNTLRVYDAETGALRLEQELDSTKYGGMYGSGYLYGASPDGRKIALSTRSGLEIRSLISGAELLSISRPGLGDANNPDEITVFAWSADSRYLALGTRQANLEVYRIASAP